MMKKYLLILLLTVFSITIFAQTVDINNVMKPCKNGYIEYIEKYQTFAGDFRPSKTFQFYFSNGIKTKGLYLSKVNLLNVTDSIRYIYNGIVFYTIDYKNKTVTVDSSEYLPHILSDKNLLNFYATTRRYLYRYEYQKKLSTKENQVFHFKSFVIYNGMNTIDTVQITKELVYNNEKKSIIKYEYRAEKFIFDSVQITTSIYGFSDFNNTKYFDTKLYDIQAYNTIGFEMKYLASRSVQLKRMLNKVAPDFELPIVGKPDSTLKLSDLKGKWVLLDFWFMRCKPCIMAFPKVEELYRDYHAKGLEVIGINIDRNDEVLTDFVQGKNAPYTTLNSENKQVPQIYFVSGYPSFFLINPEQIIVVVGNNLNESVEYLKKHLSHY